MGKMSEKVKSLSKELRMLKKRVKKLEPKALTETDHDDFEGKIYAVKNGRKIGIFKKWDEAKAQVKGYSDAEYKGFKNVKDAKNYLND